MRATRARIGAAAVVVMIAVGCSDAPDDESAPVGDGVARAATGAAVSVVDGPIAATEVREGDCLTGVALGNAQRAEIESVRKVWCYDDHTLEVYTVFRLRASTFGEEGGDYPGRQRVVRAADDGCRERFSSLGVDPDDYGLIALWPTMTSWNGGDRAVACAVFSESGEPFDTPQFG